MCGMCGQRLCPGQWWNVCTQMPCLYTANLHHSGAHFQAEIEKRTCWAVTGKANASFLAYLGVLHLSLFWRNKANSQPWRDSNDTRGGAGLVPIRWWYWEESTWIVDDCGSLNVPIEHHPTIRYMVFFMATILGDVQYTQNGTFTNPWDYCGHFVFLICLGIRWIYHLSAVEVKPSAGCQQTPRQSCLHTPSLQMHELTDLRSGWWFQTCFMFQNIWDNPSHWLYNIFQRGWNHQPVDCFREVAG